MQSAEAAPGSATGRPTAAEFYAVNRGGGLYSEAVSQRIGAVVAVAADRLRIAPTVLTLVNLVMGVAASVTVAALAPVAVSGDLPFWLPGLVGLIAWQLAYAIDCADGQLARVTGQSSAAGARVDVLADVLVQISLVTALSSAATAYRPETPAWLVAVFAGTWMVNLVTSVMQTGNQAASMVTTTSLPVRVIKLIRDYGAVVLACGLVLTFVPDATFWVLIAFSLVNGLFLMASVGHSARNALMSKR
ncbi:MAG: CDP-alcohol phosphatidyltransferase family protein [Micromonosporaceae bacterium]